MKVLTREQAEQEGFAGFNRGEHICIKLEQKPTTISVITPDGQKLTFAFCERVEDPGFQCVDIQHHGKVTNKNGISINRGAAFGQGPTVANWSHEDECTLVSIFL